EHIADAGFRLRRARAHPGRLPARRARALSLLQLRRRHAAVPGGRPVSRMRFELLGREGEARRGRLHFPRGTVETPACMPVGTYGTVKAMLPETLREVGAEIILGNTFHLWLRPGMEVIAAHGGLHGFARWNGPILTDSGGFQVWSLAQRRKITEEGVTFAAPTDGTVKAMLPGTLREVGAEISLGNTFHLWLRPGMEVIAAHGGLHGFARWNGPILTDSGGFQVWSLAQRRKITEEGVTFAAPTDG